MGDARINKTESILTVSELKKRYFHGVEVLDGDGNPLPDEVYSDFINQAISWLEIELAIDITPTERVERRDFIKVDYTNWAYLKLNYFPIIDVTEWNVQYPNNTTMLTFPKEWHRVYKETGDIQLVPSGGSVNSFFLNAGGGFLPHLFESQRVPQMYEIKYISGFEHDSVPYLINKLIGLKAAIDIFNIAGDLLIGAGIANASLSVDGLSQSVGTTSSATNAGYGARIIQYEKQIKQDLESARRYYKGIGMVVI